MPKNIKHFSPLIKLIEDKYIKKNLPLIEVGDNIKIRKVIQEGNKERIQISEGVIIGQNNSNINKTITVRKTIQNIGVERVYLIHSPQILNIEIVKKAKVCKSKLYYLRKRSGKSTRLKPRKNS
uniref:50S ribosomal protein L19 n=1 Tax=Vertebrata lanosa TaxID=1261582 RepID=A0A0B5W3C2_9FLOR|nr:50S ribosomal protein L19 [Vertebrata lanosa]AJH65890.1 50S ribosomal protein L19 [Vertebrata lanosa]